MLIDLISLAAHCLCATRIQSQHTLLPLTHTHTTYTHTQTGRVGDWHTHICTIVVIERLFKEAQLSKILVYYAESSPHHITSSPSGDKISYQRRNTHVRCQQKNKKKKEGRKTAKRTSQQVPKLSESAHELVDEAGPGPASKLTCACVHAIDILLIYIAFIA